MVYKKYIKKKGKIFGPYFYESYRDEKGRVKTKYVQESLPTTFGLPSVKFSNLVALLSVILFISIFSFANIGLGDTLEKASNIGKSVFGFANTFYGSLTGQISGEGIVREGKGEGGERAGAAGIMEGKGEGEECTPDCSGKECGDDSCGGSCGECAEGENCVDGGCEKAPAEILGAMGAPSVTSVTLTTTNPATNDTNQNLTASVSASDADGDNITLAYNWYKNGMLNATTLITEYQSGYGLVAYYSLNNDTYDYVGSNDGTNNGATPTSSGKVGGAYVFDGVDDYIHTSSNINIIGNATRTISGWVKLDSVADARTIVGFGITDAKLFSITVGVANHGKWSVRFNNGALYLGDLESSLSSSDDIGKWVMMTATYNGSMVKLYRNGIEIASLDNATLNTTNSEVQIGRALDLDWYLDGTIDEVMIFNRSLSASEVKMLYDGSKLGGNQLHNDMTTTGDIWKLGVRGGDAGNTFGDEVNSSNVTILNIPPNVNSVTLTTTNPDTNDTDQNLTASVSASDADGDNITLAYNWYKNGMLNATTLITEYQSGYGLVAYYPFNDDSYDYKGSNDGTPHQDADSFINYKTGMVGNSAELTGGARYSGNPGGYFSSNRLNITTDAMAISLWIKLYDTSDYFGYGLLEGGSGGGNHANYDMFWDYTYKAYTTHFGSTELRTAALTDVYVKNWHHIVSVYNGTYAYMYIDGVRSGNAVAKTGNMASTSGDSLCIGYDCVWDSQILRGQIDEVMIFNRGLSESEVKMLYDGSKLGGNQLHNDMTTTGEIWKLGVKGGDAGNTFGDEVNSSEIEILESGYGPVNITQAQIINKSGTVGGVIPIGTNATFNVTTTGVVANVFLRIWAGIAELSAVVWEGFMNLVGGIWTAVVGVDETFPTCIDGYGYGCVNYTLYVNYGLEGYGYGTYEQNGTLPIVEGIIGIPPTSTNFLTQYGTTNFSAIRDYTNITNMTLATQYGKIQFPENYGVNASGENYDAHVKIGSGFVSVNTSALHPSFNHTANITLYDVNCPGAVYYGNGVYSSSSEILAERNICNSTSDPSCTNIVCSGGNLTFTVSHFTGFAGVGDANLTIWDQNDTGMPFGSQNAVAGNQIKFYANYTNSSQVITGAACNICFNDTGSCSAMTYNSSSGGFYDYNRSFSSAGLYLWNATCNKTGFETLFASDDIIVAAANIPPVVNSVTLTTTNPATNDTNQNLTASVSASDADGDNITLAYNWYKNNTLNATTLITDGLVSYWPLNNDTYDYKGAYNLDKYGTVTEVSGKLGNAKNFIRGTTMFQSSLTANYSAFTKSNTDSFSFSLWFKSNVDSKNYGAYLFASGKGTDYGGAYFDYILSIGWDTNIVGWMIGDRGCCNSNSITTNVQQGVWTHIAGTYNTTHLALYKNGTFVGTAVYNLGNLPAQPGGFLQIGNDHDPGRGFNGTIDEVMFFNRTLSASEVEMLYKGSKHGGHTFGNEYTTAGDVWKLGVRGGDAGNTFGDELNSSEIEILGTEGYGPVSITQVQIINKSGTVGGVIPIGTNATFNVTTTGTVANVLLRIWAGIAELSAIVWQGFMNLVGGIWTAVVEVNETFPTCIDGYGYGCVNYTLYVNYGLEGYGYGTYEQNGTLPIVEAACPGGMAGNGTEEDPCIITGSATITTPNLYFKLGNSFSTADDGIKILADNIVIDGDGHSITGQGSCGVNATNNASITIRDLVLNNFTGADSAGVCFTNVNDSLIDNVTAYDNEFGILIQYGKNNTISNSNLSSNIRDGIRLSSSLDSNTIINLNSYDNTYREIYTDSSANNTLIYNNSYGEILWRKENLTTEGALTFPGNITIGNNSAYFNPAGMNPVMINSSADIALNLAGWGIVNPQIKKDGNTCYAPSCNVLDYAGDMIVFNVTSWSNYTVEEAACPNGWAGEGTEISPCNITECNNITNANRYYQLLDDEASGGTCFIIGANNVTLDGRGFDVTGNIGANTAYTGLVIKNLNVTGSISTAGNGTDIAVINSTAGSLSASGGACLSAGNITINLSAITGVSATGGSCNGPSDAGSGGYVRVYSSRLSSISTDGGSTTQERHGGLGGNVIIFDSNLTSISANGGSSPGYTGGAVGGSGGLVNLTNSNITSIESEGGYGCTGGAGGNVILVNSSISTNGYVNNPGGVYWCGGSAQNGTLVLDRSSLVSSFGNIKFRLVNYTTYAKVNYSLISAVLNNSAYINSTNYPEYNKSANITLNLSGWGIVNPQIKKDGNICSAPNCNILNYAGNTIVFNVTSWSNYTVADVFCGGSGTSGDPYQICDWTGLNATRNNLSLSYILMNDLNSSLADYSGLGNNWQPIGNNIAQFAGSFNGNGYNISGLNISKAGVDYVGLFGYVTGNISNVNLYVNNVTGRSDVGGLAGMLNLGGTISNCSAIISGTVSLVSGGGGGLLVGNSVGTISNCSASGNISGVVGIGGLVGVGGGTISNCSSSGNVNASSNEVGGLVGTFYGTIFNSYSTATVTGSGNYVGGLVGEFGGIISNCSASGTVTGGDSVGGLVGTQDSTGSISYSSVSGSVSGSSYIGGLIGTSNGNVSNSSVRILDSKRISGSSDVGLVVGYQAIFEGTITNTYGTVYDAQFGNITFLTWNVTKADGGNLLDYIQINNNSAYVNGSISGLNKSANVTLHTGYDGSYPAILRKILKRDGNIITECGGAGVSGANATCENLTSFENPSITFGVQGWSNYSVDFHVRDSDEVDMNTGWNVVALTLELNSTGDDRNITLQPGWNLIGYSSPNMTEYATIKFTGSPTENWSEAVAAGRVQKYLSYYNSSDGAKKYEYAGFNTPNLTQAKGYWVYVNENTTGTMTIPGVGGSHIGDTYKIKNLMFRNDTSGELKNITNAYYAGWISSGIDYYDSVLGLTRYYVLIDGEQDLNPWQGYFVRGFKDNITLLRLN